MSSNSTLVETIEALITVVNNQGYEIISLRRDLVYTWIFLGVVAVFILGYLIVKKWFRIERIKPS